MQKLEEGISSKIESQKFSFPASPTTVYLYVSTVFFVVKIRYGRGGQIVLSSVESRWKFMSSRIERGALLRFLKQFQIEFTALEIPLLSSPFLENCASLETPWHPCQHRVKGSINHGNLGRKLGQFAEELYLPSRINIPRMRY